MQFIQEENKDSSRIVWNHMPNNKIIQVKLGISQYLHYTLIGQEQPIETQPKKCTHCKSYYNPYNRVLPGKRQMQCCICKKITKIQNKQQGLPQQLNIQNSTYLFMSNVETNQKVQSGYLLLVDTALDGRQMLGLKKGLRQLINNLQDSQNICFVTYNSSVNVYQFKSKIVTINTFLPHYPQNPQQIRKLLANPEKYIAKISDVRSKIITAIDSLQSKIVQGNNRNARAIGQALNVSISLLQNHKNWRIVLFCGGPCTEGFGKVINPSYSQQMRSINDNFPKMSKQAQQYYKTLGNKAKQQKIAIDALIFSVQQVGLSEMINCFQISGGCIVQHQQFQSDLFRQSLRRFYIQNNEQYLQNYCNVKVELKSSKQIIFHENKQNQIKIQLNSINQSMTITTQFQLNQQETQSEAFYIQIVTVFNHCSNPNIIYNRVTTLRRRFCEDLELIREGFDSQAAIVALSRHKKRQQKDNISWLQNSLVRWTISMADYVKKDISTFNLLQSIKMFPQYIYSLKRHSLFRKNGLSLDEVTVSYLFLIDSLKVNEVIRMIQPALLQYKLDHIKSTPIPLDENKMTDKCILILDTFLNIVVWRGSKWNSQKDSQNWKQIQRQVHNDLQTLKSYRFPPAMIYETQANGSKQRFIKSRLIHRKQSQQQQGDIKSFMSKLIQSVVMS